ncbi:hypothetical protein LG198_05770 [Methylobacillus arboreus]|uniref:hypothetical protein n=1 Tax=Methylobacillus arboreus TaxID=755170 RepID=UPI001E542CA6|nr:hypothetical protein [Methylobacillus arboreus]MCB5190230.1 hypothetical protein [Methylobacillus arboreus]
MAIFRCSRCNFIQESEAALIGQDIPCPKCQHQNKVWDTTFFVSKLLEKYFALHQSLKRLQASESEEDAAPAETPRSQDFSSTEMLSSPGQALPILRWFERKKIAVEINPKAVDTTGFFDEVANAIAEDYATLRPLIGQICHAYKENYNGTTIKLANRKADEISRITHFCKQLHDYAFLSRLVQQKSEKSLRLILQPSPVIRQFFNGIWLEWYALMQTLDFASQRNLPFSCARNAKITLPNADVYELDVFLLLDQETPICIECKSGDYKPYIEKYRLLKKSLGLQKSQFLLCVADLPDEHAQGLTSMYDITFTSQKNLLTHLMRL